MKVKSLIIRLLVSFVALFFLYKSLDISAVASTVKSANTGFLALSVLLISLNYIISGFRWRSLIFFSNSFRGKNVLKLIKLYFVGAFFNNFLPSSIGGDVYKAYVLGKNTNDLPKSAAATFVNRLSGVVVLALFSTIGLSLTLGAMGLLVFVAFLLAIFLGFIGLGVLSKYIPKLQPFNNALLLYKNHKRNLGESLFYSLLVQIVANLAQFFAAKAVGISVTIPQAFFAFPIIGFFSVLPISFNGFGLQDWLYRLFFGFWGVSAVSSAASSVLFHFCRLLVSLTGGVLLLISHDKPKERL